MNYFGEWAKPRCDNCSNCLKQFRLVDITQDAISIFMCIDDMGQRFGASLVSEVLKGSSTDRIRKLDFNESYCYGKLENRTLRKIREEIALEELCIMRPTNTKQLLAVNGFGEKKAQQYGDDITEIIRTHQEIQ